MDESLRFPGAFHFKGSFIVYECFSSEWSFKWPPYLRNSPRLRMFSLLILRCPQHTRNASYLSYLTVVGRTGAEAVTAEMTEIGKVHQQPCQQDSTRSSRSHQTDSPHASDSSILKWSILGGVRNYLGCVADVGGFLVILTEATSNVKTAPSTKHCLTTLS